MLSSDEHRNVIFLAKRHLQSAAQLGMLSPEWNIILEQVFPSLKESKGARQKNMNTTIKLKLMSISKLFSLEKSQVISYIVFIYE